MMSVILNWLFHSSLPSPRARSHGGNVVEVENIAVQQQLDRPGGFFLDVIEERRKVVVNEELPTLIGHPHRPVRIGLVRLREVHVGDDERMEIGFHWAGSLVCQAALWDSSNPYLGGILRTMWLTAPPRARAAR
jgi:hypothetical protein